MYFFFDGQSDVISPKNLKYLMLVGVLERYKKPSTNLIQLQKCGKVEARARLVRSVGVVWLEGYIVYKV